MKLSDAFPSLYLKGDDVKGRELTATIAAVKMEEIKAGDQTEGDTKPVLHFREADIKAMVLNVTNADAISEGYGDETDAWVGKTIVIYHDPSIKFAGKKVGGVRVRLPSGATQPAAAVSTWPELVTLAGTVGLAADELAKRAKAAGLSGYHRTTEESQIIRGIIAAEQARKQQDAAADLASSNDDSIPF